MMQRLWKDWDLYKNFEDDFTRSLDFQQSLICTMEKKFPAIITKINNSMMPIEAFIQNLYCRTAMNFGFTGDEVGLPLEVCL